MNQCERMRDAMVDVAGHRAGWTDQEAAHLAQCEECRAGWMVISAAAVIGRTLVIDGSRVAGAVRQRLVSAPAIVTRNRWARIAVGLAAATLISVGLTSDALVTTARPDEAGAVGTAAAMFPELEALSEPQLEVILATVADPDSVLHDGAALPRLGDLNDKQLEELILSVEGE
ncbi:MAG: hypothetical protein ABIR59_11505 [Gemmatimonadales bacterium]